MQNHTPPGDPTLLQSTGRGLDCAAGGFTIDPYSKTEVAVVTHAHADHARRVATRYYAAKSAIPLLKKRLGDDIDIRGVDFGEPFTLGATRVSLHPAGHILGSAQIRVEHNDECGSSLETSSATPIRVANRSSWCHVIRLSPKQLLHCLFIDGNQGTRLPKTSGAGGNHCRVRSDRGFYSAMRSARRSEC